MNEFEHEIFTCNIMHLNVFSMFIEQPKKCISLVMAFMPMCYSIAMIRIQISFYFTFIQKLGGITITLSNK